MKLKFVTLCALLAFGTGRPVAAQNVTDTVDQWRSSGSPQYFIEPNREITLHWPAAGPEKGAFPGAIEDYTGKVIASVNATVQNGIVSLPVRLSEGFYVVRCPLQGKEFGLSVQPAFTGKKDPFFGIDASLSWLSPVSARSSQIAIMRRMGVSIARERLTWADIEPSRGQWDWESRKKYELTRKLYSDAGIGVLELFHAAPAWITSDNSAYPNNLPEAKESWKAISNRWSGYWGGIEVWNEPDIDASRGGPQAERYVPIVKTVKYALQSTKASTPVGGGVFGYLNRSYMDLAAENGLLETIDFLSFHYYREPFRLENTVAEYKSYVKQFGRETLPIWITEAGEAWKGTPHTRPPTEEDQKSALQIAELAVEAKSAGVARIFPFVLVDYSEQGTNNYGMLDPIDSPVRSFAAYSQAIKALSNTNYIGSVDLGDKSLRARVFQRNDDHVVCVIEAPTVGNLSVDIPFRIEAVQGIDGRRIELHGANLALRDGVAYVWTDMESIQSRLARGSGISHQADGKPPKELPIVLEANLDTKRFPSGAQGYEIPSALTSVPVRIRINNLSPGKQNVSLTIASTQHAVVQVDGGSSSEIVENIPVANLHFTPAGTSRIRIEGIGEGYTAILPATLLVSRPTGLNEHLSAFHYRFALPIGELSRWVKNSSGDMQMSLSESNTVQISATVKSRENWTFPWLAVPQEVDLNRVTGVVLRARCERPATVRVMTWNLMTGNSNDTTGYSVIRPDGEWHIVYVPFADFIPPVQNQALGQQVRRISLGFGSSADAENQLEVSDLILVGN